MKWKLVSRWPHWIQRAILFVLCPFLLLAGSGGISPAPSANTLSITFEGCEIGAPPVDWVSRNGKPGEVYSVRRGETGKFIHADAQAKSVQIGVRKEWSLQDLPILEWRWKAIQFPVNTDERERSRNDSVLALYVVFGSPPFYKAVKYIWSDTLPVGSTFDSPVSSRVKMIVIESGRALAGRWIFEKRNVLSDYHRLFNTKDIPRPNGVAILTDADDTASRAVGDYGTIEMLPSGPDQKAKAGGPQSRLPNI